MLVGYKMKIYESRYVTKPFVMLPLIILVSWSVTSLDFSVDGILNAIKTNII